MYNNNCDEIVARKRDMKTEQKEFTHTYENSKGNKVKCFIALPTLDRLRYLLSNRHPIKGREKKIAVHVTNENGCGVYLDYNKLSEICQ